jgi:hypothetical protein
MTEGVRRLQRTRLAAVGGIEYTPDELIVHFKPAAIAAPGIRAMRASVPHDRLQRRCEVAPGASGAGECGWTVSPPHFDGTDQSGEPGKLDSVRVELLKNPAVASVSRGRWMRTDEIPARLREPVVTPDDPNYPNQSWHYTMIGLPEAWAITTEAATSCGRRRPTEFASTSGADRQPSKRRLRLRFPNQCDFCAGGTTSNTGDGNGYDSDPTIPLDYDVWEADAWEESSVRGTRHSHLGYHRRRGQRRACQSSV